MKGNKNALLIYENKCGSKIIWKYNDETWWLKSWMHERRRQEDRSSPQKSLMLKLLLQKLLSKPIT